MFSSTSLGDVSWYLSFSTLLVTPFSKAKCLPEEMDLDKRKGLSQATTDPDSLQWACVICSA